MKKDLTAICKAWAQAKAAENNAKDAKNIIETILLKELGITEDLEGVKTTKCENGLEIKVTGKMTRKIDGDKLQDIANEQGIMDYLAILFRWEPKLNMEDWKNADAAITTQLLGAITTKPAKPSFAITFKEVI